MATTTARFSKVVERAGQPEAYTLWVKPEQDKAFSALLRQHRVMTVHQETTGSKADYGQVGYIGDRQSNFLVFPKSLKRFEGKRIIGIKYDELKDAPAPASKTKPAASSAVRREPARKSKKKEKTEPAPRPKNEIPFPAPKTTKRAAELEEEEDDEEEKEETAAPKIAVVPAKKEAADPAKELADLKKAVRKALAALSKDKPVSAFNVLQSALDQE